MIKIYHNTKCSKSRQCLAFLKEKTAEIEVIDYMKNPPTEAQLVELLQLLAMPPIDLVRKKEALWKEFSDQEMSDKELIEILVKNPKLIERPIVVKGDRAIIARPAELVLEWL